MSERDEEKTRARAEASANGPERPDAQEAVPDQSRRAFLKKASVAGAALAGSVGAGACTPDGTGREAAERRDEGDAGPTDRARGMDGATAAAELPEETLRAMADVALPTGALGADGADDAIAGFLAWVDGFEAAAELDHPYLTGELRYGPPHPGPRWAAQLRAMELESRHRTGVGFAERPAEERREIVAEAIGAAGSAGVPGNPARADHVSVGLLAWFYGTSEANDLCYRAQVGRHLCRGTASLPTEPEPLPGVDAAASRSAGGERSEVAAGATRTPAPGAADDGRTGS